MKPISQRFNEWVNQPVNFPAWFGYFLIALLASFITYFILVTPINGIELRFQKIGSDINHLENEVTAYKEKVKNLEDDRTAFTMLINDIETTQHKHFWK